jgi:hypothetical protein
VIRLASVALLVLAGCASVPIAGIPLEGEWGGQHVALHLQETGGTLDYDCANGTIGPVVLRSDRSFSANGTHTPGHGGPVRVGEVPPSYSVDYSGGLRGDRMTLEGRLANGVRLGPYELQRGAEPRIFRCL